MSAFLPAASGSHSPQRSYAPVAGQTTSPLDAYPSNGGVVYPTRVASSSSMATASSSHSYSDEERMADRSYAHARLKSESEETLSPVPTGGTIKGKARAEDYGYANGNGATEGDYDLGEIQRGGTVRANGRLGSIKGKERAWDAEGLAGDTDEGVNGSYPPVNEDEDEERKIQEVNNQSSATVH